MCIVIDMNTFPTVFNTKSQLHSQYLPVFNWVIEGRGKLVCGGTKYWKELSSLSKYIRLINQLNKAGKVIKIDNALVDLKMAELQQICKDTDFDDPHITALLIVSGCKVICSEDERSYPYLTRREWYPKRATVPKIYKKTSFKSAEKITCDSNIAEICLPCKKPNKAEIMKLKS